MRQIFLILLFLSTISLFAQNFKGGVIGGLSTSQVSGDNLGGYNKASLFIGIFTELPITNISNIKMEMNYIGKGSHNPKMLENGIPDISISYLEVPVSINYYQNDVTVFEAGMQAGFLLSSTDNDIFGSIESNINNPFNKLDVGAFVGMSYHLSNNLVLNTRISNSILPIREHSSGATFLLNKGQYNTVLSFTIHYYIL